MKSHKVTKKHSHPKTGYKTDGKLSNQDQHEIVMGQSRGIVYLLHEKYQCGGNWYFRHWVSDVNKLIKKSLRTKDKETAIRLGEDELLGIVTKQRQGHEYTQYRLGELYGYEYGNHYDPVEAAKWYTLAAEQGYVLAQSELSQMYNDGEGVPEDDEESFKWIRLAAKQGHVSSQYVRGLTYYWRSGVREDKVSAYMWYTIAHSFGYQILI